MATERNLHEVAVRKGWRFPSVKGDLSVENLWQLPLTSNDGCNLDAIAVRLDDQLEKGTTKSFVKKVNKDDQVLKDKLELVQYIIDTKMAEDAAKVTKATKDAKRRELNDLLARKEAKAQEELTPDEIKAQLAALDEE